MDWGCVRSRCVYIFHIVHKTEVCFQTWSCVRMTQYKAMMWKQKHGERGANVENVPDFSGERHGKAQAFTNIKQCSKLFVYLFIEPSHLRKKSFQWSFSWFIAICRILTTVVFWSAGGNLSALRTALLTVYFVFNLSLISSSWARCRRTRWV